MIFRPGNLSGFSGMRPANKTKPRPRSYGGLGAFGKGFIAPPPTAPSSNLVAASGAINSQTGQPYMQDPQCSEGMKMESGNRACHGDECCDIVGDMRDCDPEGTMYPYQRCVSDPLYKKAAPLPAFSPAAASSQSLSTSAPSVPAQTAEEAAREEAEAAKLEAELMKLEAEQAQVDSMVTSAPVLPSPSSYTGSPAPVTTRRSTPAPQTSEQKLASLVEDYQTRKAMQRATAPAIRTVPAPTPVAVASQAPAPTPVSAPTSSSAKTGGIFSWLRDALFGAPTTLGSYELKQSNDSTNIILPIVIVLGLMILWRKKTI